MSADPRVEAAAEGIWQAEWARTNMRAPKRNVAWSEISEESREGYRYRAIAALAAADAVAGDGWSAQFDAMAPEQERLAIEFCNEIAGQRGKSGSPPDPVRLLEMAYALYQAERRPLPAAPQKEPS